MTPGPKQAPREEHMADVRWQNRALMWLLGVLSVGVVLLGLFLYVVVGGIAEPAGLGCFAAVAAGWAAYGGYLLLHRSVISPAGDFAGHVLMPTGSSTPPAKGLSHIEAMVARGDLVKAAEAYQAEIAADPGDVASCERLGVLAQRDLQDFELAAWAFRQAERRAESPARKFGYGLLVVGVYRDKLKDRGKAVVELSRLVQRYPDAPRLDALRAEIEELKAGLFDDRGR